MASIKWFLWYFFHLKCPSSTETLTEDTFKSLRMGKNSKARVKKQITHKFWKKIRYIQTIVKIVKKLKSSSGLQWEKFISKVKKERLWRNYQEALSTKLSERNNLYEGSKIEREKDNILVGKVQTSKTNQSSKVSPQIR